MHGASAIIVVAGVVLIVFVLRDAFETMILPRRLQGRLRFTRMYYRALWPLWAGAADKVFRRRARETALSWFGPLSMLLLFVVWAVGLMIGFALVYYGLGPPLANSERIGGFGLDLYMSGSMFLTLGLGNAAPASVWTRLLAVFEGGLGFGFVAVIISYLPVLYSGFSNREAEISRLDAHAGSPPSASELLRRHARDLDSLEDYFADWERWSASLLESHISYPVLGYFRSQHVNQSWLAALATVLDATALLLADGPTQGERCACQAQLTFAMSRHAVVDLAQIFIRRLPAEIPDRLPRTRLNDLCGRLDAAGLPTHFDAEAQTRLAELRGMYEPHLFGMSRHLRLALPDWVADPAALDNWQRSPWERPASRSDSGASERSHHPVERHF